MGVFEKLKNALFEVEYIEEEVPTKKEKKTKPKETDDELVEDKPIAKKIVLPGKKDEKVEVIKEEELRDENFEIRPKNEFVKSSKDTFKFMDDDDFKVDEDPVAGNVSHAVQTPVITPIVQNAAVEQTQTVSPVQSTPMVVEQTKSSFNNNYVQEYASYKEKNSVDDYLVRPKESKPYGMDPSYQVSIKQYGSYENRDEKTYFKPSPIISPIYGVLDKNYKKEDVVPKKNVRISTYSRGSVNVDDVRNKAFAERLDDHLDEPQEPVIESSFEVEEDDDNLLVDLNNDHEKPEVKEITVGDAVEYFDDLGLEYNVDYVDVSNRKKKSTDLTDDIKMNMDSNDTSVESLTPEMISNDKEGFVAKDTPTVAVVNESSAAVEEDDDNLFDLIDSMYKEDK